MADAEMAAFARRGAGVAEAYELVTSLVPARRPASAPEVAAVVAWLLSDASSYVKRRGDPGRRRGGSDGRRHPAFDPVEVRRDEAPSRAASAAHQPHGKSPAVRERGEGPLPQ